MNHLEAKTPANKDILVNRQNPTVISTNSEKLADIVKSIDVTSLHKKTPISRGLSRFY